MPSYKTVGLPPASAIRYAAWMWTRNADILVTDLGDELVLMHPTRSEMFSLNQTGRLLWQRLPASLEDLSRLLTDTYGLSPAQAQADASELLTELRARDLVREG